MVKITLLISILFLVSCLGVNAAQDVDITVTEDEVLKYDFQPGTFTTMKLSEGATIDFTYGPAFGTFKIKEITGKEIKIDLSKNGGRAKTILLKTGEKMELDLLYNDLSEIDITPTLVKSREGSQVIMTFNSYKYSGLDGKLPESFSVLKKEKSTTDPYLVGLILGIILLGIILLVIWKKTEKRETKQMTAPIIPQRSFDEEELYVAGTMQRAKVQPQIPPMSILKEDITKAQVGQPTTIPHSGAKVEQQKEVKKKSTKKVPAKKRKSKA